MNKYRKHPRFILILGLLLAISLLLVACSDSDSQQTGADADTDQEYQVVLPAIENNRPSGNEADNEAYPAPEEMAAKPTPRGSDLVATDPATVSLASGQLQLVEMFAFW